MDELSKLPDGAPLHEDAESAPQETSEHLDDTEIMDWANKAIPEATERWNTQFSQSKEDLTFLAKEHWPTSVIQARGSSKPAPVYDLTSPYVNKLANEARESAIGGIIRRSDDADDGYLADILQGHIRHTETTINSKMYVEAAAKNQVACGIGWLIAGFDWIDQYSWRKGLTLESPDDPTSCMLDPDSVSRDGSDAIWCVQMKQITKAAAKSRYGIDVNAVSSAFPTPKMRDTWVKGDLVNIAKMWRKVEVNDTLCLLTDKNGTKTTQWKSDIDKDPKAFMGLVTIKTREGKKPIVMHYIIIGGVVNHKQVWPSSMLPIVPVYGDLNHHTAGAIFEGEVRKLMDPQRSVNYYKANETEFVALAPRAKYLIPFGGIDGFEAGWDTANSSPKMYLYFNPVSKAGTPLPTPQLQQIDVDVSSLSNASSVNAQMMSQITGAFDGFSGTNSIEESGKAILAKQKSGDRTTAHYSGNLAHSYSRLVTIWVDIFLGLVTEDTEINVEDQDGKQQKAIIGLVEQRDPKTNKVTIYDSRRGRYAASVSTGPSYASKRDESAHASMELMNGLPDAQRQAIAPAIVQMQDWPEEQKDRVYKALLLSLPPEIQAAYNDDKDSEELPQEAKAMLEQLSQEVQQSHQESDQYAQKIQELTETIKQLQTALLSTERDAESRVTVAQINAAAKIQTEQIKAGAQLDNTNLSKAADASMEQRQREHDTTIKAIESASEAVAENERAMQSPMSGANHIAAQGGAFPV